MKNSVTQEDIDYILDNSEIQVSTIFDKVTLVALKLPNGFVITESSGAVSKENYNLEIGKEICIKKLTDKIWMLEGYALQKKLQGGA